MKPIPFARTLTVLACLAGTQAFALQGGSVMPEYVNFAPADNPDVVNLNTGDFNYTIPLGEVPGPYGSFPLSMGYSAGIGPNQEATWVGLGWTLNPGAINRSLRGAPDDQFHGGELSYVYQYSKTTTWGVQLGYSSGYFSLNMSYNSTGGYGYSASIGPSWPMGSIGVSFGSNGIGLAAKLGPPGGVGLQGNISFSGGKYSSSSVGIHMPIGGSSGMAALDGSVGLHHQSGKGVSFSSGFGIAMKNGTGISVSSQGSVSASYGSYTGELSDKSVSLGTKDGGSASFSVQSSGIGITSSNGASSAHMGSATFAIAIPIPQLAAVISFGYNRNIYENWVRQATNEYLYGYMYQAGPAILANGQTRDDVPVAYSGGATSTGNIPWTWNYKGKTLDRIGDPLNGDPQPAWDLFQAASDGVSGTFHAYSLTRHSMLVSLEKLNPKDDAPQYVYYLLDENAKTHNQLDTEFTVNTSTGYPNMTNNAYGYCYDGTKSSNKGYYDGYASDAARVAAVNASTCSKYAFFKSNHLNESNRLVFRKDADDTSRVRSRMVFRFMADGFFSAEDTAASSKLSQFQLHPHFFQKSVNGVNYGLWGGRRIEPILEGDNNTGRLQGFKITNTDGTQYFFTQPVRTLLQADYTTNQERGAPLFLDRHSSRANDNFLDLVGNAFVDFASFTGNLFTNPSSYFPKLVGYYADFLGALSGKDWLFDTDTWTGPCTSKATSNPTDKYNFSYTLKTNPYATQWLLKEIRGPEFVQLDPNDMTKNVGYQVKFNYTEPTRYKWRFPYAAPNTPQDSLPNFRIPKNGRTNDNCVPDMYQASFGVKELVYLSSIETATHKAVFELNNNANADSSRLDGKGWIQDWSARSQMVSGATATNVKSGAVPLFLNVQLEAKVVPVNGSNWTEFCKTFSTNPYQRYCWYEKPVSDTLAGVYLNMAPTQQQIDSLVKNHNKVMITGFDVASDFNTSVASPLSNLPGGLVFPRTDPTTELRTGNSTTGYVYPTVGNIYPATRDKSRYGSYYIQFSTPIVFTGLSYTAGTNFDYPIAVTNTYYVPVYRYGMRSVCALCPDPTGFGPKAGDLDSLNKPIFPSSILLGPGGRLKQPGEIQPLMCMNDFYETKGPDDNQMHYLTQIRIGEKVGTNGLTVSRKFVFTYDWNIQPGTLNSYPSFDSTRTKFSLANQYPSHNDPSLNGLGGKLNLKKVQEFACGDAACSQSVSLPPFRFFYKEEGVSPFYRGEDFTGSIVNSSDPQDEWGFWNKYATHENHKVRQDFADYGAAAWSLEKVIDPSGGALEVQYERDTYRGESYEDETSVIPVAWNRCTHAAGQDTTMLCIDVMPRQWATYCDKNNKMRGEYTYNGTTTPTAADYNYIGMFDEAAGKINGSNQIYFELDGGYNFEVGCGPNIFGWRAGSCHRERTVAVVGSATINPGIATRAYIKEPILGSLDSNGAISGNQVATQVKTLQTNIPFMVVMDKMKQLGKDFTNHEMVDAKPIKGVLWVRQTNRLLKGGDIRVKKLVKRDIGLSQTTTYKYDPGEMSQYPDSVLSTAFAERFSPAKVIGTLPGTVLPSISRIPGVPDNEVNSLPGSKITYPRVTVFNVNSGNDSVLNGKTEYKFITPESGVDLSSDGYQGMLRINVQALFQTSNARYTSASSPNIRILFIDGQNNKIDSADTLTRTIRMTDSLQHFYCRLFGQLVMAACNETNAVIQPDTANMAAFDLTYYTRRPMNIANAKSIRILYGGLGGGSWTFDLPIDASYLPLKKFTDISLSLLVNELQQGRTAAGIGDIKQSNNVPIVFKKSTPAEDAKQKQVVDFTAFMGKPLVTTYYRWIPASGTDRNLTTQQDLPASTSDPNYAAIAANLAKYKVTKQDSFVYTSRAPSADDRFITAASDSLGVDEDLWQYKRKYNCLDSKNTTNFLNCDWKGVYKGYRFGDFTRTGTDFGYRKVNYTRYSSFTKEMYSKTGFNNSSGAGDYIVTKLSNFRFDPVTGTPTMAVTYSGPGTGLASDWYKGPAKATRTAFAYTAGNPLANTMFERNMLSQVYREDAYTWTKAVTDNGLVSGTELNFNSGDISNQTKMGPALTAVKITPFTQSLLNYANLSNGYRSLASRDNPILGLGSFTARFNPANTANQSKLSDAGALLSPSLGTSALNTAFLRDWAGTKIDSVNSFFKTTDEEDIYGVHASHRYDPTGFHQIAVFNNAPMGEAVAWTVEGRTAFPDVDAYNQWRYSGGGPTVDGNTLVLTGNFTLSHSLQWLQNKSYLVEFQLHSPVARACQVATYIGATMGNTQAVALKPGLNVYQYTLKANLAPGTNLAANRIQLSCQDGATTSSVKLSYFRAYPDNAEAGLYVYDKRGNVVQMVNEQNVSTYYEYDWFGNLTGIRNDDGLMFTAHKREWTNVGQ